MNALFRGLRGCVPRASRHTGLCALLLVCAAQVWAAGAPDPWLEAAHDVLADPFFEGLPVSVRVLKTPASDSAASLRVTEEGRCELLLQHRANPKSARLIEEQAQGTSVALLRRAVIVHELAHCWRYQDNPRAVEGVFQLSQLARTNASAAAQAEQLRQQEETFADMAALSWVEHRHPDRAPAMLTAFFALRTDPRFARGAHDTLEALERVRRHGMVYGETPFHAADTMLAVLRPGRSWSTGRRASAR